MVRRKAPCLTICLLFLFLLPATRALAAGGDIAEGDRELILQHAYRNLTRFAAAGGEAITFRVGDLQTVDAVEFDRARWSQLMTMPGGDMIDMTREVREFDGAVEAVIYRPKWNLDAPRYLQTQEGRSLRRMTVAEVLRALAVERPEAAHVTAITSYEVTVTFGDRSRTYRAAVLWLPASPGRGATLFFQDHITQGLEEAVREGPVEPRPRAPLLPPVQGLSCYASSTSKSFYNTLNGYDGHFNQSTSHHSVADVNFACSCETDCTATCQSSFSQSVCADDALFTVDSCHVMASAVKAGGAGSGDGVSSPPACAAGLGCVKRSCLYCACGLSVKVDILGTEVTFTPSGQPDWQGNLDFSWTCLACTSIPEGGDGGGGVEPGGPLDNDPGSVGGGDSGGGAGSFCCWRNTSCFYDANGVYTCVPTTCGKWSPC